MCLFLDKVLKLLLLILVRKERDGWMLEGGKSRVEEEETFKASELSFQNFFLSERVAKVCNVSFPGVYAINNTTFF